MPLGAGNSCTLLYSGCWCARFMNSVQMGRALRAPSSLMSRLSSKPTHSGFGPEYLTYVLWAISPDGRPVNLGELTLNDYGQGSGSSIEATSDIQTFGLIVTAEPYYGVTQPSDVVVLENIVRTDTQGVIETINARYELLRRAGGQEGSLRVV
jgi:hypothetical protein